MMLTFAFLALVCSTLAFATELDVVDHQRVKPCGQFCKFRLCNFNGERLTLPKAAFVILGAPKTAQLPYVCRPGEVMGGVVKSGEAKVRDGKKFVAISKWKPAGLKRNFRSIFIRTYKTPFLPHSSIGRVKSSTNQWSFLHDQCMIMPITRYERINLATGRPIKILNASGKSDCVAFRTTAPTIQIEMQWDTPDDFDLEVTEPDGDVLSFRNKRTEYGKLNGDNNVGFCGTKLLFGKENVLYFPNPKIEKGKYKIKVIHYTKCADRPTNWKLSVVINGVVKVNQSKFSAAGEQKIVGRAAFNF